MVSQTNNVGILGTTIHTAIRLFETAHLVLLLCGLYSMTVTQYGQPVMPASHWGFNVTVVFDGLIGGLVQVRVPSLQLPHCLFFFEPAFRSGLLRVPHILLDPAMAHNNNLLVSILLGFPGINCDSSCHAAISICAGTPRQNQMGYVGHFRHHGAGKPPE